MGTYSWQCAKSKLSIPDNATAAVQGPNGHLMDGRLKASAINLHLNNGMILSGIYQGWGELAVIEAHDSSGKPVDLDDDPILSKCGGWRLTIEAALEATESKPKLVRQDQAADDDRYETLAISEPCPMGGHFYSIAQVIDVVYLGDANLAWKAEAALEVEPQALESEFEATKSLLWTFLMNDVPDQLLHDLNSGELDINDVLDAMSDPDHPGSLPMGAPMPPGPRAEFTYQALFQDAEYAPSLTDRLDDAQSASPSPQ